MELSSDYVPEYSEFNNGMFATSLTDKGVANELLSISTERTLPGGNQSVTYDFVNELKDLDTKTTAVVTKSIDVDDEANLDDEDDAENDDDNSMIDYRDETDEDLVDARREFFGNFGDDGSGYDD